MKVIPYIISVYSNYVCIVKKLKAWQRKSYIFRICLDGQTGRVIRTEKNTITSHVLFINKLMKTEANMDK